MFIFGVTVVLYFVKILSGSRNIGGTLLYFYSGLLCRACDLVAMFFLLCFVMSCHAWNLSAMFYQKKALEGT